MRLGKRIKIMKALTLSLLLFSASCSNVFRGMSRQDSDEALYEDAKKSMNALDWDSAISKFHLMSTNFMLIPAVRENYAGALAGKCGFNFMDYLSRLQSSAPGGGTTTMQWLMQAFNQKLVSPSYCALAEVQIRFIGSNPTARTSGQNLFLLFLSLAKIGTTLRNRADIDSTSSLGDGTTDATFNACSVAPSGAANVLSDNEIREIITGLGLAIENAASLPASASAGIGTALTAVTAGCPSCSKTDTTQVSAADITLMRNLLADNVTVGSIGVGGMCPLAAPICCP